MWVEATLPPKPGSSKQKPHQQRLSTGYKATKEGLKLAVKMAKRIRQEVDTGSFDWSKYSKGKKATPPKPAETCGEWLEIFRQDWERKRVRTALNWQRDWSPYLNKLPADEPLTVEVLESMILSKKPNSCSRQKAVQRAHALAKFAGIECNFKHLSGTYSKEEVEPRSLPEDAWIEATYLSIEDPQWQRVFGLMAVYGIRNTEVASLDFTDFPILRVTQGKNGVARAIAPRQKEWAESWDLQGELPVSVSRQALGSRITRWFKRRAFIKPSGDRLLGYDLRHCAARGWVERGADAELAARMMGHSVDVHRKVYRRFIGEKVWLDRAMSL